MYLFLVLLLVAFAAACDPRHANSSEACECDFDYMWFFGRCRHLPETLKPLPCNPTNATYAEECTCDSKYRWRRGRCFHLKKPCGDYHKWRECASWCRWNDEDKCVPRPFLNATR